MNNIIDVRGMKIYCYIMPGIKSNMYLIREGKEVLIIDPNINQDAFIDMQENNVEDIIVLLTHEHSDHISGVNWLRERFQVKVIATEAAGQAVLDATKNLSKFWNVLMMDKPQEETEACMAVADKNYVCWADTVFGEEIHFFWNDHFVRMQAAPGHSPGGALVFIDEILFSGDNLVNGSGVICRLPGGSWKTYCEKTKPVIEALPDDIWVFPGHGEPAKLGELRKYLNKFGTV